MKRSLFTLFFPVALISASLPVWCQEDESSESLEQENPLKLLSLLRSDETGAHKMIEIAFAFQRAAEEAKKSGKINPDYTQAIAELSKAALDKETRFSDRWSSLFVLHWVAAHDRTVTVPIFKAAIDEESYYVRNVAEGAIRSFKKLEPHESEFLIEVLKSKNRTRIIRALQLIKLSAVRGPDDQLWTAIVDKAQDHDSDIRSTAIVSMALALDAKEVLPDRIQAAQKIAESSAKEQPNQFSIQFLRSILNRDEVLKNKAIEEALQSSNPTARLLALEENPLTILSRKIDESSVEDEDWPNITALNHFAPLLQDPDEDVRTRALEVWEEIRLSVLNSKPDWLAAMDQKMKNLPGNGENKKSSKEILQGLATKHAEWVREIYPPNIFDENKTAWNYAMRSLSLLFITQSSSQTPEVKNIVAGLKRSLIKENATAPVCVANSLDQLSRESNEIFNRGVSLPTIGQLWGSIFHVSLLRSLEQQEQDPKTKEQLLTKGKEIEEKLASILKSEEQFRSGRSGSLFHTFAVASAVLALEHPPQATIEKMNSIVAAAESPLQLPYDFGEESGGTRESAARNIPFYLALYLKDTDLSRKPQHREHLLNALDNYVENLEALTAHVIRNNTHVGDGLAPYYFYASVPYVTAATKILVKETQNDEERARLKAVQVAIEERLHRMIQDDGLFVTQGSQAYPNSSSYVNPLAGLALISLVDESKNNFGVVIP